MHPLLLSGSPILDVDATLLVYVAVFFVLFFVLRALVFRPMMALFDAREAAIDGAKREARDLEKRAEQKLLAFEDEMAKVRTEVGIEREKMKAEARRTEQRLLEKVRKETDGMLADATESMNAEGARMRGEIAASTPGLAKSIAEKLLGRGVAS
ncbi:MAG: ATP synthase F0 subunit B [Sandaracinaceae bacterium]|nr:ATP synthase F0 subunit B [Sandaracinaceae bacterium]